MAGEHHLPVAAPGDLLAVVRRDAETWAGALQAVGLSAATIRSRWIALRSLYGWCVEEEELTASPFAPGPAERLVGGRCRPRTQEAIPVGGFAGRPSR